MRLKLFGRDIIIGKDLSQYAGRADDLFTVMQQRYGTDYRVRNRLEAYKNVVYACVSLIGEAVGNYAPQVERKKGDQWEKIDHEFLDLLYRPSGKDLKADSFSQFDLFETTISYMLLQGECFWYMALGKTTGRPREIVVLRPDKVGTDIDKNTGEINGYFIRQSFGDPIPLEINEVLRFNFFNPKDPYKGMGIVEAGNDYIGTDESTATYTKNFFNNNAGLSGVLNIKGEVTKNAFRKFVRAWRDKYEGVTNAGKVAILRDSEAAFTKVGLGLDELDMAGLRKMSLDDVLMMFKVPLPLLGKAEQTGLGRANVEALEYIFAKYNIDKKMDRFDSVLQFALNRYYPQDINTRVVHENIVPEDKEFELNERNLLTDKVFTRNEMRDEDGLDPVEGGDQLFVPMTSMPLDEASSLAEAPGTEQAASAGMKIILKRTTTRPRIKEVTKAERFRLLLMRNQVKYERQYRKVCRPIIKAQHKEALVNLEAHSSRLAKAAQQKLFDDAAYDAMFVKELTPMLTNLAQTQGGLALVFAGDTENEFHMSSKILSHIQKNTLRMASNFNDETLEALNKTLAEGIQAGEGIAALKQRVTDVYDGVGGYRAERIARTETLKASNDATVWAYRQTGYVTSKQWVVNPDSCPECGEFDGKTVPLDDDFLGLGESYTYTDENGEEQEQTNDYDTVEQPPLHPNCRCTVIPIRDTKAFKDVIPKDEHDKLLKARAKDQIYIKELEGHLGLDDEPATKDTETPKA